MMLGLRSRQRVAQVSGNVPLRALGGDAVAEHLTAQSPQPLGRLNLAALLDLPQHGQVLIPTGELMDRISELEPESEIVLYCRSGARSEWAVKLLLQAGFSSVLNLRGGVLAWRAEVDPTMQAY